MNKKVWLGIAIAIVVIAVVVLVLVNSNNSSKGTGLVSLTDNQDKGVLTIGVVGPLSGDAATWNQPVKNAIDLAAGKINQKETKVKLIYEDNACDPKTGINAVNKLIETDNVDMIIETACSSVALAEAPIAEQNKKVLMLATASNPKIKYTGDYTFRVYTNDAFQGKLLAEKVYGDGIRNVSMIVINNDYGKGLADEFSADFTALGGKIITTERHDQSEMDYRTIATKIKNSNPEAIIICDLSKEGGLAVKQLKEQGVTQKLYGADALNSQEFLDITKESSIDGLTILFPKIPSDNDYKAFQEEYIAKYGVTPEAYSAYGYDALMLVEMISDKVNSNDSTLIKDELYNVKDYKGITGYITLDSYGERVTADYEIMEVVNNQFVSAN